MSNVEMTYDPTQQMMVPVGQARVNTGTTTPAPVEPGATPDDAISIEGILGRIGEMQQREAEAMREQQESLEERQRTDAFSRMRALLQQYNLSELETAIQGIITGGTVDIGDPNAILFALREEPAYQRRFAGNAARARAGLPELDPITYINMEQQYRELMRSNGLPVGFYDQNDDFRQLIEGDVSPNELQRRIEDGYRRVQDADPEVRRQMQELYNVSEGGLAAYFLDPQRAEPLLNRQAKAAQIAARGREQGRLQLTAAQAEDLASRGITGEEAQAAFAQRGALAGLYGEMGGEQALTEEQKLGATFGYDIQAQQALQRRQRTRLAEFQSGGQFARTTGATSGTAETGIGTAQ